MNANELADWIRDTEFYDNPNPELNDKMDEVEAMLRQQQTELTQLRESKKEDVAEIYKLKAEIESLKSGGEAVAKFKFPDAEDYAGDYEMDCDEGIYHPSEKERFLIADALMGYISDLPKLYTHPAKTLTDIEKIHFGLMFLSWNRSLKEPLVKIAYEQYVFEQAAAILRKAD